MERVDERLIGVAKRDQQEKVNGREYGFPLVLTICLNKQVEVAKKCHRLPGWGETRFSTPHDASTSVAL